MASPGPGSWAASPNEAPRRAPRRAAQFFLWTIVAQSKNILLIRGLICLID